ncbi:BnaCnng65540D [Brassica napus]|uniref:BnaCnng65540D protein n=1 Tax=Brassica napus TaxID=3708 RepID=A0A078JQI0_BRANA|nr:BnaCnng65540D [Brassica napus]
MMGLRRTPLVLYILFIVHLSSSSRFHFR